jgi:uncharacterized Tic20 family protein
MFPIVSQPQSRYAVANPIIKLMSDSPTPPVAPIPPSAPAPSEKDVRMWNMLCHLSSLSGLIVPFGNILGPLLIWQLKKNEFPSVEVHGKAALNFQITVLIAAIAGVLIAIVLSFFCVGWLLFPVVMLIGLAGMVFAVIAGIKANDGHDYEYPFSFKLL